VHTVTKRWFDVFVSALLLVLTAPLMGIIAMLILWKLGSPVLFRQRRPGRYGRPFTLNKFRTMVDKLDARGELLPNAERVTRLGRMLRFFSVDELPQLWNVLRGDMSLVGPRPLLMKYLDLYSPEEGRRHNVLPGMTGWAQVNGRNAITWKQKFELDVWYVDHQNFWLDLKILVLTVPRVLRRHGVNHSGHVTAPEFQGEQK
jgi:sugar transferase EpsL